MWPRTASAGAQQTGVNYAGTKKMPFSCICNSAIAEWNCTMLAVESPLG